MLVFQTFHPDFLTFKFWLQQVNAEATQLHRNADGLIGGSS